MHWYNFPEDLASASVSAATTYNYKTNIISLKRENWCAWMVKWYIHIARCFTLCIDMISQKIWLLFRSVQLLPTTTKSTLSLERNETDVPELWNIDAWYCLLFYVVHRYDFPEDLTSASVNAVTVYNYKINIATENEETDVYGWWSIDAWYIYILFIILRHIHRYDFLEYFAFVTAYNYKTNIVTWKEK